MINFKLLDSISFLNKYRYKAEFILYGNQEKAANQ